MKKNFWLIVGILLILFVCLGNLVGYQRKNDTIQTSIKYDNNEILSFNHGGMLNINFDNNQFEPVLIDIRHLEPNKLYSFSFDIDLSESIWESTDINVILYTNERDFFNSKNISNEQERRTVVRCEKIIKSDSDGVINVYLHVDATNFSDDIELKIENLSTESIEETDRLLVIKDTSETLEMVFKKDDFNNAQIQIEAMSNFINSVALIRDTFDMFTEQEYDGMHLLIDCTQKIPVTGLAGNPIYINQQEVDRLLSTVNTFSNKTEFEKGDFFQVITHEISHVYDMSLDNYEFEPFIFDREFFATFKQIYALRSNGYKLGDNFLSNEPKLSTGIYNHEVLISRIDEMLSIHDNGATMNTLTDTFSKLRLGVQRPNKTANVFLEFIKALSIESGVDIKESFEDEEWDMLARYFRNQ